MVGAGTIAADDPADHALEGLPAEGTPIRIVLDAQLRTAPTAQGVAPRLYAETILVAGRGGAGACQGRMNLKGVRVIDAETRDGRIDLDRLMDQLARWESPAS